MVTAHSTEDHSTEARSTEDQSTEKKSIRPKEMMSIVSKTMVLGKLNVSKHCCNSLLGLGVGLGIV